MGFSVLADNALDMLDPSGLPVEHFYRSFVSLQLVLDSVRLSECALIEINGGHCDKLQLTIYKVLIMVMGSENLTYQVICAAIVPAESEDHVCWFLKQILQLGWHGVLVNQYHEIPPSLPPQTKVRGWSVVLLSKRLMLNIDFQSCLKHIERNLDKVVGFTGKGRTDIVMRYVWAIARTPCDEAANLKFADLRKVNPAAATSMYIKFTQGRA